MSELGRHSRRFDDVRVTAWDPVTLDYYWGPGTWVEPPQPELLWTPAWWGWVDSRYGFHPGYWGRGVGF